MGLDNDEVILKKGREKSQAADADASASSATNKRSAKDIPAKCILETIVTQPVSTKINGDVRTQVIQMF